MTEVIELGGSRKSDLVGIVGREFPVLVVGPGCHRVGYDDPDSPSWKEVQRRIVLVLAELKEEAEQNFLKEFYFSKLSDERRTPEIQRSEFSRFDDDLVEIRDKKTGTPDADTGSDAAEPALNFDPWRSRFAAEILRAYREASCCLGQIISAGSSPVLDWRGTMVPRKTIVGWASGSAVTNGDNAIDEGDALAREHFRRACAAVGASTLLANAMYKVTEGKPLSHHEFDAITDLPGVVDGLTKSTKKLQTKLQAVTSWNAVDTLKPNHMATMLSTLTDRCFSNPYEPLRGAHVEWLGDLFWYALVSDTRVQPSQAELAFYVTVTEQKIDDPRDLRRPAYGDRRSDPDQVSQGITELMKVSNTADAGSGKLTPRTQLLSTIAKCLVAQYRVIQDCAAIATGAVDDELAESNQWVQDHESRLAIALETQYGDHLESQVLLALNRHDNCHVVLPVWAQQHQASAKELRWLFGTAQRDSAGKRVDWVWLEEASAAVGPIVVKLNGSYEIPFTHGTFQRPAARAGICGDDHPWAHAMVTQAILYDDHDRLTATQSFEALARLEHKGLIGQLHGKEGLSWDSRSWVIMGQSFADWVARLRMFTRWSAGSRRPEDDDSSVMEFGPGGVKPRYWAIDRSFDWPERALLTSLGFTMAHADLAIVGTLPQLIARIHKPDPLMAKFIDHFQGLEPRS